MEELPQIAEGSSYPVEIFLHDYLKDHVIDGKVVLPAVEIMQICARWMRSQVPGVVPCYIHDADFQKFLVMDEGCDKKKALVHVETLTEDGAVLGLVTKTVSKRGGIGRKVVHATMGFSFHEPRYIAPPHDIASSLEGVVSVVPAEQIYEEAVPFGPRFRNVRDEVYLSQSGALGRVSGPSAADEVRPLGSPFPLDAAFHIAALWGQRYFGMRCIPVGIQQRLVLRPAEEDVFYTARVMFRKDVDKKLIFDLWIYDDAGFLCEAVLGLAMRCTGRGSAAARKGPGDGVGSLAMVSEHSVRHAVYEHRAQGNFADMALTENELARYAEMGDRRKKTFLGARLASKMVWRRLSGDDWEMPAESIHTVHEDDVRPAIPRTSGNVHYNCSVSHDSRFSIAAASGRRIGIDVEEIADRLIKVKKHYVRDDEAVVAEKSGLEIREAFLRIWSIKEAVSKAVNISLTDSWEKVSVRDIGYTESVFFIDDISHYAYHDTIDSHVFTLVIFNELPP